MPRHTTAATGAKKGARWSTMCTATSQESPAASAACTIGTALLRHRVSRRASSSPRRNGISSMAPTPFPSHLTAWRDIRQQKAESLRHREVRENGVAQLRIRQLRQHRRLHRGHDLTGLGPDHGEPENAVVAPADEHLHEAGAFTDRLHPSTAPIGSFATRALTPWRRASPSLSPTWASGGSVNRQYGISRSRVLRVPPARLSLTIWKSSTDACV